MSEFLHSTVSRWPTQSQCLCVCTKCLSLKEFLLILTSQCLGLSLNQDKDSKHRPCVSHTCGQKTKHLNKISSFKTAPEKKTPKNVVNTHQVFSLQKFEKFYIINQDKEFSSCFWPNTWTSWRLDIKGCDENDAMVSLLLPQKGLSDCQTKGTKNDLSHFVLMSHTVRVPCLNLGPHWHHQSFDFQLPQQTWCHQQKWLQAWKIWHGKRWWSGPKSMAGYIETTLRSRIEAPTTQGPPAVVYNRF